MGERGGTLHFLLPMSPRRPSKQSVFVGDVVRIGRVSSSTMGCCYSTESGKKRASRKSVKSPDPLDIERAKQATKSLTEFALNLFKMITAKNSEENDVFSSASIALALALIESGADGSTRTALRNVLNDNGNDSDTSAVYRSIQRLLQIQEDETTLTIANGLFYDRKFKLKSKYLSNVKEGFEAEIDGVDFENNRRAAASHINSWISKRTGGRIKDLLQADAIDGKTAVIVVTAIYLKASWRKAFRKDAIEAMPFYRRGQDENPQTVAFLKALDKYDYSDDIEFHTVGIPYSSSNQLLFYIILPKERNGIRKVEEQLTEAKLRSIIQTGTRRKIDLSFPKFGMRTPIKLKPLLKDLGLDQIFERTADFSRMKSDSDDRYFFVDDVLHEAFVKLDENGTEAAAATAIRMKRMCKGGMSELSEVPIRFVADHPFIFAIVHQQSETVVFMGKVNHVEEDVN